MIAKHAAGKAAAAHAHGDAEYIGRARTAINQIANEDNPAFVAGVDHAGARRAFAAPSQFVAELREQKLQFIGAAVNIADDIEGSGVVELVDLDQ